MRHLLILCLLLYLTMPFHAQDESTPNDVVLQHIREAAAGGLAELRLSGLGLTELPPEIGQLLNLQKLYLDNNQLTSLPSEIGQLSNLQRLDVSANQLTSLPPEIGQLKNLEYLILDYNQLRQLPAEIGQLPRLGYLWLSHNQLRQLPTELSNLTSLTYPGYRGIVLDNNPLVSPPPEVVEQGTRAVLTYLRHHAWYFPWLVIAAALDVGLLVIFLLWLHWKQPGVTTSIEEV